MKLPTKLFLLLLLFLSFLIIEGVVAQDLSKINQQFFTAYTTNSTTAWRIALQQLENAKDEKTQLVLAKGYYGAAGTAMGNRNKELAGDLLDKAAILTKRLLKKNSQLAEANALLSSVYGMKIGLSPMRGMLLGSKSNNAAEKGLQLAPDMGFTNYVKGSNLFYTPSMFGGDKAESIEYLEKARSIYETSEQTATWEYLSMMTLLGQAYHNQKKWKKAIRTYEAALLVAPNFAYIKKILLPRTEKAKS